MKQQGGRQVLCTTLAELITAALADAPGITAKVWHGSPVWFSDGNPIVGYSALKDSIRLLFWSGQSFDEPGLTPEGSFKAADARYTDPDQLNEADIKRWIQKAIRIQWDYKNIIKRRGVLERVPGH